MELRIEQLRKQKGLTQGELAMKCGTTQQQIAKIEKGLVDIKLSTLNRVAAALEKKVVHLFYSSEEFLDEINDVIEKHGLNLKKITLLEINTICSIEKKIPSFHPYWERVAIKNNKIILQGGEKT